MRDVKGEDDPLTTNTPPFVHRPPCHRAPPCLPRQTSRRVSAVILPISHPNQTNVEDDGTGVARNVVASTTTIVCDVDLHANSTSTTTTMNTTAAKMDADAWRQGEGHGNKTAIAMVSLGRRTATTQVPSERGRSD